MRDGLYRRARTRSGVLAWLAGMALGAGSAAAAGAPPPARHGADRVLAAAPGSAGSSGHLLAVRASHKEPRHDEARSRHGSARDAAAAGSRPQRDARDRHEPAPDQGRSRRDTGRRDTGHGDTGRNDGARGKGRHRDESSATSPPKVDRSDRRSGPTRDRGDGQPTERATAARDEAPRGRRRRDTNRAASTASTPAGPPPERPLPLDEGDGFQPPAEAPVAALATRAEGGAGASLVPDYLPAPAASAPVTAEDFERAFPGLAGLEPCDAVERLRATLKLRGVVVSSAEPDRVWGPAATRLASADAGAGTLRHLVRSRDTNTAHQGRSSARERSAPRASGRGRDHGRETSARAERDGAERDSPARDRRHGRDTGHARDTGQARGPRGDARPTDERRDRRDDRRPVPAPAPRYVPPALSSHAYRIPSDALIARIRELQPACDDQRVAERSGRPEATTSAAPAPESEALAPRRSEPAAPQAPAAGDADAPGAVYQSGMASWYGRLFHGRRTASGERYDMFKYTAAHLRLPLGTFVRIWRRDHRKAVVVKVNDRGPYHSGRILDLSYAAAQVLGLTGSGSGPIEIELLDRRTGGTTLAREEAVFTTRRLEAGAFTDPADAEVRRQTLADAGFADAVVVPVPGVGLYAVRVGPYATASALEAARARIERLGLIVDAVPD